MTVLYAFNRSFSTNFVVNSVSRMRGIYTSNGFKTQPKASVNTNYFMRSSFFQELNLGSYPNGNKYPVSNVNGTEVYNSVDTGSLPNGTASTSLNLAYDKLVAAAHDNTQSSMGETLGEWEQSIGTIRKHVITIANAYIHLRNGNFNKFVTTLGIKPLHKHKKKAWSRPRQASALFLEYHFGWDPLVKDIQNACDIIQAPPHNDDFMYVRVKGPSIHEQFASNYPPTGDQAFHSFERVTRGTMGVGYKVTSPNLNLYNSLGLVNGLQVAWNLVPLSFVADWFLGVSRFLGAMCDFVGMSLTRPWYGWKRVSKGVVGLRQNAGTGGKVGSYDQWAVCYRRSPTLYHPVVIPPTRWKRLSNVRAATACALLVQLFAPG